MKFSFFNFSFVQKIQLELFVNASFSKHQSKRTSRTPSNDRQNLEEDISTRNRSFRTTFSNPGPRKINPSRPIIRRPFISIRLMEYAPIKPRPRNKKEGEKKIAVGLTW